MKQKTEKTLVLCDEEEEYAQLMTEFLNKQKGLPWILRTYTDTEELYGREAAGVDMLVVAESAYSEKMRELCPDGLVILNESGLVKWEGMRYVDKYSRAEEVYRQLLAIYAEITDVPAPRLAAGLQTKFVGNYSPVRRCMQTSFALALGQMLAEKHRTLYLNFEHYAGMGELLPDMRTLDLADLLYFLNADREKFRIRMQALLKRIGQLDYIPPMKAGQNLLSVTEEEWLGLLRKIAELGEYEYVILDLSESMQGLFEILRLCSRVFTQAARDTAADRKLTQYEQVLALYEYGDVLEKTSRLDLTHIHRLPNEPEQLTRGELAEAVRELMQKL